MRPGLPQGLPPGPVSLPAEVRPAIQAELDAALDDAHPHRSKDGEPVGCRFLGVIRHPGGEQQDRLVAVATVWPEEVRNVIAARLFELWDGPLLHKLSDISDDKEVDLVLDKATSIASMLDL